jgi:PucR family transcriptional regulator, purine catabolism regulatory protein
MPAVIQLVRDVLPSGARVEAGEAGLYNEVSWIATLRPTPPGFESLKGNELAIVGSGVVAGLGTTLSRLVATLAERKVSAILVLGEINAEACQMARSKDMPLIQISQQADTVTLEAGIARFINEERQLLYQKEREYSQSLMEIAVAGSGASAILARLKELTGRNIGLVDLSLKPHFELDEESAKSFPAAMQKALLRLRSALMTSSTSVIGLNLTRNQSFFLGPVKVGKEIKGYLMAIAPESEIGEIDRLAVRAGSLALAVELSRRQAVKETEGRFEEDIVETLISGEFSSQIVSEKARKLNLDLSTPYVAMLARPLKPLPEHSIITAKVMASLPKALTCFRPEDLVILCPVNPALNGFELRQIANKLADNLNGSGEGAISLGIGRPYCGLDNIRLSFQEAEQAIAMGIKLFGPGSVTGFSDLGVYRLLLSIKSDGELKAFYNEYMGKLSEYENKHDGELSRTLKTYLRRGTVAETAREIHVHRNTLLYRLARIREITGLDLEDGETRLALHLAILAGEVLHISR